jgi:hypothetical protein
MTNGDELPSDQILSMRDDLDFAHAIMRHAVRANLSVFSFAGLRIPPLLQSPEPNGELPKPSEFAGELITFQEQLYDRIVSLADNKRMLGEIWGFNERSRAFRQSELTTTKSARKALAETADLVDALIVQDTERVLEILDCSLRRRLLLLAGQTGTILPFPDVRRRK